MSEEPFMSLGDALKRMEIDRINRDFSGFTGFTSIL
jgi:hypothetical protein